MNGDGTTEHSSIPAAGNGASEFASGLCLVRAAQPTAETVARGLPWLTATLSEHGRLPPPGVVLDIGLLALSVHANLAQNPLPPTPHLRNAMHAYEDCCLARLAIDPRLVAVRDAFRRMAPARVPSAVGILVSSVLTRLGVRDGIDVSAAVARRLVREPPDSLLQAGFDGWRTNPHVLDRFARFYEALAQRARETPALLAEEDVFTLENVDVLASLAQRVAIGQVVRAAAMLQSEWPRRLRPRPRRRGSASSRVTEESEYPAGGFASVTTSGALENLVTSELVYMDRGVDIDLFDVRYAEGELLYYSRDDAVSVRRRRLFAFALTPTLVAARTKDPDAPLQRIVFVLGWILAAVQKLVEWLGDEQLEFLLVELRDPNRLPVLAPERALLELVLREWQEKGMARFSVCEWGALLRELEHAAERAEVDLALVGDEAYCQTVGPSIDPRVGLARLDPGAGTVADWQARGLEVVRALV